MTDDLKGVKRGKYEGTCSGCTLLMAKFDQMEGRKSLKCPRCGKVQTRAQLKNKDMDSAMPPAEVV